MEKFIALIFGICVLNAQCAIYGNAGMFIFFYFMSIKSNLNNFVPYRHEHLQFKLRLEEK